jgi:NAD(P)-dependent dehydrogenase (short-subunit alcohol dehydrogenase family)
MPNRLAGKTAIITGGGQGIGEAIARRFADEGARVVIADVNAATGEAVAADLRAAGHTALAIQTDVADSAAVNRLADQVGRELGPADVLVNNAGIVVFRDPLHCTDDDWRRCFSVDLDGVWYGCRAFLPQLIERGGGSIINIASSHASQIIPNCFPYPVAKHGLVGLTRALAIDMAAQGVRVNAISPGYILTPNVVSYWSTFPDPAAERARVMQMHPVKRIGTPDEVAWTAVFLASDEAGFMTGANLQIDGGMSILYHE